MLINVKDESRMPIIFLWQLIYTFTFAKKSCAYMTKDIISQQLLKWHGFIEINKAVRLQEYGLEPAFMAAVPIGKKGSVIDEMEFQLQSMCSWVVKEEAGKFQPKVDLFTKHKIDFRLAEPMCHAFPEHANRRNMNKGKEALRQAMKDNPQDYADLRKKKTYFVLSANVNGKTEKETK